MVNEINEYTQQTGQSEQQQSASPNQLNQSSQPHEPRHKSPLPLRMRLARVRRPAVMSLAIHPHIRRWTDALFIVLFLTQSAISLLLLQWSINPKLDLAHDYIFSPYFAGQVLFSERHMLLFNLLLLMAINMGAILLTNQFWIGSALFCAIVIIYSIANRLKMVARNEPILASDVTLATGNAGEIASFIPDGSTPLITGGVAAILAIGVIALAGSWYFGPGHILTIVNTPVRWITQIVLASILFVPIGMYAATVGDVTSTAHAITMAWGDQAKLFDAQKDSNLNGTLVSSSALCT